MLLLSRSLCLRQGALITGLSNLEVAAFLLKEGLEWADGCCFLDENDKKMVLVRATERVVELDQCGIAPTKLFAVYDQIHTTGKRSTHIPLTAPQGVMQAHQHRTITISILHSSWNTPVNLFHLDRNGPALPVDL
jgi:hypothetical protein